ncbi:MAG: hypothetical protein IPH16_08520 [Haliscomenobacter sp.]|nr:hypothetical protein [Haliscomenobacter sp.]
MERVSSNLTLFYRIFVPVFWIVFFGSASVALIALPYQFVGSIPAGPFRIGVGFFFLSGAAALYFTLMQLKRVEIGGGFVYVTNYFKNYRYPYNNIERIEVSTFLFFSIASIYLKTPGNFGQKVTFAPEMPRLKAVLEANPELKKVTEGI